MNKLRQWLLHPTSIGVAVALLISIGLMSWFFAQAARQTGREREAQIVIEQGRGLAARVGGLVGADTEEPGSAALAREWSSAAEGRYLRIVRLSGARLLASTFPEDRAAPEPRRLRRDEKPLFDLGHELRAAVQINRIEGGQRKRELLFERVGTQRARVTVPFLLQGAVAGYVQIEMPSPHVQMQLPWASAIGFSLLAWLLVVAIVAFFEIEPLPLQKKPWRLTALAMLLFGSACIGFFDWVAQEPGATLPAQLPALRRSSLTAGLIGFALLVFVSLGFWRRVRKTLMDYRYAYAYIAPAMIGMLVLVFFPFIYGIALSFTGQTILNVNEPITELWVGLQNYAGVLGDFDVAQHTESGWSIDYQNFYWTLGITIVWTISNVSIGVSFGMILALALNTAGLRGKPIYRVLLILPWAIPNYITALIWRGLFHPQFGAINQAVQMFGGEPVAWFDSVPAAFLTGLATNGWLSFPFMMVVILGGLQSISADMYEAATVEGASRWQQFRRITLPLLKPTLIPAVVLSVVWTFNMFNVIYLVSGGAPAGANEILITKAYKIAFEEYRYGYAAAYSVVIFAILLIYGVLQTRITRATEAAHA